MRKISYFFTDSYEKYILLFLEVIFFSYCAFIFVAPTHAEVVTVIVTEEVPGAKCTCIAGLDPSGMGPVAPGACGDPKTRKYSCDVEKGMVGFQNMFRSIIKWFVYIIMLLGVLALVGAGILWAWGSESEEYTKKAKGWAVNIIIGLAILFSFRYILGFLAPWIFQ